MFLIEICLDAIQARSLKDSEITRRDGNECQLWVDGHLILPDESLDTFDPDATYDGIYNFIYLSKAKSSVIIANDPLGQKPLYYRQVGNYLYLGSCFWDLASINRDANRTVINEAALESLLVLRRIVPAHHTLHSEINILPAGAKLINGAMGIELHHVWGMMQRPDRTISTRDAASELKSNLLSGFSRIKESGKYSWFWFGNSGGLDSRVIPALADEAGLGCKGFLVSGDRIPRLKNQSKLASEKVAEKYGVENLFIDFRSKKCTVDQRISRDLLVNPFGPANYHKNADYCRFRHGLVVNGGNSFLIANDNGSWKRHMNKDGAALNGYFNDILVRKGGEEASRVDYVQEFVKSELDDVVDLSDPFSVCRTLHQKYLNKTSPMGAFESMNWVSDFHYMYYSGASTLYRHWPKEIFFDRSVQKEFMGHFYPDLISIADQGGNKLGNGQKKTLLEKFVSKARGNGLAYGQWLNSRWLRKLVSEVKDYEFLQNNSRSRAILSRFGQFSSAQDNLDMVKIALVVGMIESGIMPDDQLEEYD